jgi:TonB family protein
MLALIGIGGTMVACGGSATSGQRVQQPRRRMVAHVSAPAPRTRAPDARVRSGRMAVAGLTGSLSPYEVREALEPRAEEFGACFVRASRRLRGLGGRIQLAFHVDATGRVETVRAADSTIGHRAVERCLLEVAAETRFPRPQGGEADFSWPLEMDSVSEPTTWDPSRIDGVVRRFGPRVLETCVAEGADRPAFQVTTYVSRSGRVIAAGAVMLGAADDASDESLDCVASQVRRWRMPRATRNAKVTFELREDMRLARR